MSQVTITDRDREAADALHVALCQHGWRDACLCRECRAAVIAQAREEGRREEREACAKVCEAFDASGAPGADISTWGEGVADGAEYAKAGCAAAIRARGNATLPAADAASEV